jgi:hypothetical protein
MENGMKITNNLDLPQPLVKVVTDNLSDRPRSKTEISVTSLLAPPQIARLRAEFDGELTTDVSDHIYALMGTMVHQILEQADSSSIREKRLKAGFIHRGELVNITGQFDRLCLLSGGVLQDWKTMSVWEHIFGLREDRIQQLNLYRWLAMANDIRVTKLQAVGLFRDWRVSELNRRPDDYPRSQVAVYDIPLWDFGDIEDLIEQRLDVHWDETSQCSPEDRWYDGDTWAVSKEGQKRALKLFKAKEGKTLQDADDWMRDQKDADQLFIELRHGRNRRCEDRGDGSSYCPVSEFCPQWKALQEAAEQREAT